MHVRALLGEAGFARIEAAIAEAETRTSGEIVFMVVERSDSYIGARALFAAAFAFAAGIAALATPIPVLWIGAVEAGAFALAWLASAHPVVLRPLLQREWRRSAVHRAAACAFLDQGVAHTRERTGILLYLSLLEHEVIVLADRGIAERVEPEHWNRVIERILDGVRTREAERGASEAVVLCADVLAAHFPPRSDNPNELPDSVRT